MFLLRLFLAVGFALLPWLSALAQNPSLSKPSLRWQTNSSLPAEVFVEAQGLNAEILNKIDSSNWSDSQWQKLLSVYAEQGDSITANIGLPPMTGSYSTSSNAIRFVPQFPLAHGIRYRATFDPGQLPDAIKAAALISAEFQLPPRSTNPTTTVAQVYPTAEVLPENLLKFYLHFSAPMQRGAIYDHIHLRDQTGKPVELPFLEIDEELWDRKMMRLTLFIDPGRIKREVKPLVDIGPALVEGKEFTLIIDKDWRDATGNPLKSSFEKKFRVGPADRNPPDPKLWKIESPQAGKRAPVTVSFTKSMDHALAQRVIRITEPSGQVVAGAVSLEDHERRWLFLPEKPWKSGAYDLTVETAIEDLAGNNIGKPFEVDLIERGQVRVSNSTVKIPFKVD